MKPFSLHTVLKHRKRLEDTARQKLIDARSVLQKIEERFLNEQQHLEATRGEQKRKEEEGIEVMELIRYEDHVQRLESNLAAIEKMLHEKAELVKQAQSQNLKPTQERQVLDKLKEIRHETEENAR